MSERLVQLRSALAQVAADDRKQPPHARAFADWIQMEKGSIGQTLEKLAQEAAAVGDNASRLTAHAATLGYAVNVDARFAAAFADAVEWLRQRRYFAHDRPLTFEVDGLALLGTALGIMSQQDRRSVLRTWLRDLIGKSLELNRPHDWNESLIAAALSILNETPHERLSDDLRQALASKGLIDTSSVSEAAAWLAISSLTGLDDGMTRAAAQRVALAYLLRNAATIRIGTPTVDEVARLLQAVERSLRRWVWETEPRTRNSAVARWDIENEFHVQDMLWAILAPIFPDLDDEEWLKSLGHHKPRADLAIPSLRLIVEVKFLRQGQGVFAEVTKELAADASTYLQDGSGYRHILAFVWDDVARTEQHAELRQGLKRIRGVHEAIVVSRPFKMQRKKSVIE